MTFFNNSAKQKLSNFYYGDIIMKKEDFTKKDKNELAKSVLDLKKKLNDIRFKRSANQLKNVNEIKNIKKEIARMLTIIRENRK